MGEVNRENLDGAALSEKRKSDLESEEDDNVGGGSRKKHKTETANPDSVPESKGEADGNEVEAREEERDSDEDDEGCEEGGGVSESSSSAEEEAVDDDRKGEGIVKRDKGKGKLEVEEESDSDDGGNSSDGDSDLSDDPLLEVDLNNILPSRTRRRATPHPASFLVTDFDEDSDSDDSDA